MTCMCSNEAERANLDIYDDFKLKKNIWYPWFINKYFSFVRIILHGGVIIWPSFSRLIFLSIIRTNPPLEHKSPEICRFIKSVATMLSEIQVHRNDEKAGQLLITAMITMLGPYSCTRYDISWAADWSRWPKPTIYRILYENTGQNYSQQWELIY